MSVNVYNKNTGELTEISGSSGADTLAREALTVEDDGVSGILNFGVDTNGDYGYMKLGENTVTPFGGGTADYADLENKPSIEGVTLSGNKTASDLGLVKDLSYVHTDNNYTTSEKEKLAGLSNPDVYEGTTAGLVPNAGNSNTNKFLKNDGTWDTPKVIYAGYRKETVINDLADYITACNMRVGDYPKINVEPLVGLSKDNVIVFYGSNDKFHLLSFDRDVSLQVKSAPNGLLTETYTTIWVYKSWPLWHGYGYRQVNDYTDYTFDTVSTCDSSVVIAQDIDAGKLHYDTVPIAFKTPSITLSNSDAIFNNNVVDFAPNSFTEFYSDSEFTTVIPPIEGAFYVDLSSPTLNTYIFSNGEYKRTNSTVGIDYEELSNKPSIEGVSLLGNKTAESLGLAKASDIPSVYAGTTSGLVPAAGNYNTGKYLKNDGSWDIPTIENIVIGYKKDVTVTDLADYVAFCNRYVTDYPHINPTPLKGIPKNYVVLIYGANNKFHFMSGDISYQIGIRNTNDRSIYTIIYASGWSGYGRNQIYDYNNYTIPGKTSGDAGNTSFSGLDSSVGFTWDERPVVFKTPSVTYATTNYAIFANNTTELNPQSYIEFYSDSEFTTVIEPKENTLYVDLSSPTLNTYIYNEHDYVRTNSTVGIDYGELINKPSIDGTTLVGNKTAESIGLAKLTDLPAIYSGTTSGLVPTAGDNNTGKFLKNDGTWASPKVIYLGYKKVSTVTDLADYVEVCNRRVDIYPKINVEPLRGISKQYVYVIYGANNKFHLISGDKAYQVRLYGSGNNIQTYLYASKWSGYGRGHLYDYTNYTIGDKTYGDANMTSFSDIDSGFSFNTRPIVFKTPSVSYSSNTTSIFINNSTDLNPSSYTDFYSDSSLTNLIEHNENAIYIDLSSPTFDAYIYTNYDYVKIGDSSGSIGVDYANLSNKPSIEGVTLSGNKTASDLGLVKDASYVHTDNNYTTAEKNKLAGITSIPSKTSDLTNDSGFIINTVNNLTNYYLKTETYSKTEIDTLVSTVSGMHFEIVNALPTTNILTDAIYLVPSSSSQTSNIKDEYINLDGTTSGWEQIGSTAIDLSGYVTTTALNTALADYVTATNLTALLGNKQDVIQLSTMPTASVDYVGKIVQYIGTTDLSYTHGYFYECKESNNSYSWGQITTQDGSSYTAGDGIVIDNDEISADVMSASDMDDVIYALPSSNNAGIILKQTITIGNTTVTFTGIPTEGDVLVDFYNSLGINYTEIAPSSGSVTLTYPAQSADMTVYCEIREV